MIYYVLLISLGMISSFFLIVVLWCKDLTENDFCVLLIWVFIQVLEIFELTSTLPRRKGKWIILPENHWNFACETETASKFYSFIFKLISNYSRRLSFLLFWFLSLFLLILDSSPKLCTDLLAVRTSCRLL